MFGRSRDASDLQQYQHPADTSDKSPWSALAAAMPFSKKVNEANTSAAQSSRTIEPTDPLSLQNMPEHVGPEIHIRAAQLYEVQSKFDKAAGYYQKALEVAPESEAAHIGLARLFDRQGNFAEAVRTYQKALEYHPNSATIHNDLGICLARQNQLPQSIAELQQAVQLQPQDALYRNNIAKVLVQAGRADEALPHLTAVFPAAAAHYNLGYMLYQNGRSDLAAVHFNESLKIDPAFSRAARMLQTVQSGPAPTNTAAGASFPSQPAAPRVQPPPAQPYTRQIPEDEAPVLAPPAISIPGQ
jgi:tetratricopeptide (TPR) repeat protein